MEAIQEAVSMGRHKQEEPHVRYSVLVPEEVDTRLKEIQEDAGENTLSDTVRRLLRDSVRPGIVVKLSEELAAAVNLAASLSGLTPDQVVTNILRPHLGSVIQEYREAGERLRRAIGTPEEKPKAKK